MVRIRAGIEDRCSGCKIHKNFCFCDHFSRLHLKTKVSIVMHVSERKLPSNTAWITKQALDNCSLFIRGEVNHHFEAAAVLSDEYIPLFLFPEAGALPLTKTLVSQFDKPVQLIVPDGNWHQAKKVKMREKGFASVQSVCLKENYDSIYSLRQEPFPGALCTLEAISYALKELEGEQPFWYLMEILKTMVYRTDLVRRGYNQLLPL
ncbi:MAG: hypothetical protein A2381_17660 [Bdellovibrionales bacterium RIFOXYB1_FULL_37_110]|nr:MAG: hypothetical protein A2181_00785 [Bdellovibrionales bacterium RIFOXYA1_FULL_38_20]OFZ48017.1 MAG: hypothetical protein A2417_15635 [Bdellovibrionales bacterium RIFOXYC1_FULL_37_79]OFZ58034.1 MAG: hypothetical protein A2381_17660 [Bdellovibrionales bacterium RIFOXYB1_FULL_37_110]OFZ61672.1 MAG: hypothetical protein A2577_18125 [Bdellovibrionales bacterium RIFOXYD1_FULL_36_51]